MATRDEMRTEIFTIASAITASTEGERELLGKLCAAAEEEIARQLRPGVTAQDCAGSYVCAAAWMAAGALELTRGGEDIASLRAGDLTIRKQTAKERQARSRQLCQQAWRMLSPYVKDGTFFFRGVKG
ncbi:MAG: hypothetical protein IIT47_00560 [Oscillospiraceae bacterium]|nr:hypothetical protein [Oscillospiraceae bacterium]